MDRAVHGGGALLWRICFFGTSIRVQADLREKMFDHSRRLSQQYYQVNKVGNLMSLYTNDLDTIQECFGDGILMFFDALVLGLLGPLPDVVHGQTHDYAGPHPGSVHVCHRHRDGQDHDQNVGEAPAGVL